MNVWTIYFDGACEPTNPSGYMVWSWIILVNGERIARTQIQEPQPSATNNRAEWFALGCALAECAVMTTKESWPDSIDIFGDSQLVIHQLNRKWQCKNEFLGQCRDKCLKILEQIGRPWKAQWIPREQNEEADALGRAEYERVKGKKMPDRSKR